MKSSKGLFFSLAICVAIFGNTCSTSSERDSKIKEEFRVLELTLESGELYVHDLGLFGDEEYATILRPPEFSMQNELVAEETGRVLYLYKSSSGFVGEDYVIIESKRGSDGESINNISIITILRFTITASP